MEEEIKKDYYKRLTTDRVGGLFIDQYIKGSGNELKDKFWSPNSSSRLAFDVYSWIPGVVFEKQLPGVICSKSGPAGVPNMDVYIETPTDIIFIESKYTESAGLDYQDVCTNKKKTLSPAYWKNGLHGGLTLKERFYNNEKVAVRFSNFCKTIQNAIINEREKNDGKNNWKWFDAKQETCHLFGVLFFALNGRKKGKNYICDDTCQIGKKITLCNIVWELEGDELFPSQESLPAVFEREANQMMKEILGDCFEFKVLKTQDLLDSTDFFGYNFQEAISFGISKTVKEQAKQYEDNKRQ